MNPDCRDGKHASCSGDGWDVENDQPAACPRTCHTDPTQDPEGRALVQAIHDRKARAHDAPV